ncbi:hypothetical protein KSP39_PZI014912 [Platanthera zijinensis]|uniref:Fungal lipase-type domain-containing protein n=1 Tax=Platanthera zijinensis TaxID=2320716 RepID=A0AAP0G2D9_9ASPA
MHICAGVSLLSPPHSLSPAAFINHSCSSSLKPLLSRRSESYNLRTTVSASLNTRTHLENLSRLLSPVQREELPSAINQNDLLLPSLRLPHLFSPRPITEEDPSPRSLAHLRHLLSDSAQYPSPRRAIASRWSELHGCADWSGLLDPLDPDLRRELLRYGDFIHSAYHAFFHSPVSATDDPRPVSIPDRSYRLTRHLFATASIDPPNWLPSSWTSPRSSWIGFVAVCDNDREIRRMGRRDIVVALRGTSTFLEWAENLRANLVPLDACFQPKVECGFRSLYKTPGHRVQSLSTAVAEEIRRLVKLYDGEELSITVTGHSLGAALSLLVANDLNSSPNTPPVTVFSFGGPRVGNRAFAELLENRDVNVLRVVNAHDLVTKIPAAIDCGRRWLDGYEHVGRELRVDSRVSPFLKPDADPACCHDLEAYLHLVDGLGGGEGCQFRPNAKRSLARLLSQQRGNVKRLFVRKAMALGLDPTVNGGRAGLLC